MPSSASPLYDSGAAQAVLASYRRFLPLALKHATPLARSSKCHGRGHWARVASNGADIAATTPGADPVVIGAFAAFHDSRRLDEWKDIGHGPRASALVSHLHAHGELGLTQAQVATLMHAIREHNGGAPTRDKTRGACMDSDRLDIGRVGSTPRRRFMSTAYGRRHSS